MRNLAWMSFVSPVDWFITAERRLQGPDEFYEFQPAAV
jgi:hypothetical protein